jgi:hypothetical protein
MQTLRRHGFRYRVLSGPVAVLFALLAFCVRPAPAADSASARGADLEFARTEYLARTQSLEPSQRRAALAYLDRIGPLVGAMSDAEFLLAVARIPAFAENAHDVFDSGDDSWWPDTRLPVRLVWFPDGLLVARAAPAYAALAGARITRIEGLTPAELLDRLRAVCGGTEGYCRWNALWVVSNGDLLQALGAGKSASALAVEVQLRDGRRRQLQLPYVPEATVPKRLRPTRLLSPQLSEDETAKGWQVAATAGADPLYLQQPDTLYRAQRLDALDALYVQLRSNVDEDGQQLEPFLKETLAQARASPPHNLVLDLRFDVGGDISQSRELLRELVRATTGRIFVLISRYTFSAGIVSAAAVRHDGGKRVKLIGEPVGDRLRFWSEGGDVCMPNSHYCLRPTTGLWDLEHGCKSVPGCYGDQFDATAGSLQPQLSAPLTAAAWLAGRDLAMEAVASELRRR